MKKWQDKVILKENLKGDHTKCYWKCFCAVSSLYVSCFSQKGVDKEFFLLFSVMDENMSWYIDKNVEKFTSQKIDVYDEDFEESNKMHGSQRVESPSVSHSAAHYISPVLTWHLHLLSLYLQLWTASCTGTSLNCGCAPATTWFGTLLGSAPKWTSTAFSLKGTPSRGRRPRVTLSTCSHTPPPSWPCSQTLPVSPTIQLQVRVRLRRLSRATWTLQAWFHEHSVAEADISECEGAPHTFAPGANTGSTTWATSQSQQKARCGLKGEVANTSATVTLLLAKSGDAVMKKSFLDTSCIYDALYYCKEWDLSQVQPPALTHTGCKCTVPFSSEQNDATCITSRVWEYKK